MSRPRVWLPWLAVALGACSTEPAGTPVALPAEAQAGNVGTKASAWSTLASEQLELTPLEQTWVTPAMLTGKPNLLQALYALNQAAQAAAQCAENYTPVDCSNELTAHAPDELLKALLYRRIYSDALGQKAEVLLALGKPKAAADVITKALRAGDHPYHHRVYGDALLAQGKFQEALAQYEAMSPTLGATHPLVLFTRGLCKVGLGEPEGADLVSQALEKNADLRAEFPGAEALLTKHKL